MNALQDGLKNGSARASPAWASDDSPLLLLSPEDRLTLRQSFEGMFVTGQTGSGKTTGPGQSAAVALLRSGAGGLFTTTRPDDARTYMQWARLAGREMDVRVFSPQQKWRLSLLDYAYRQSGSRGAGDTDNVVALLGELLEFKNRGREAGGENQFWYDYAKKALGHFIDLLACAGERVSFAGINRLLQSTPRSLEEVRSSEWQQKSICNQLVDRAVANKKLSAVQQVDLSLALEFTLSILPRMDERLRSGIIATLDSLTYLFTRGQVANLCGGEETSLSLTPEDTFQGAIIILDLPIKEFHQTGQFIQVLVSRLWQQAAERRDLKRFPRPLFFFSDEAQNFLTRQSPLFASTARGARVACVWLTQNLDSLQSHIGKADTEALLGNCNLKLWCSNDHVPTNEWAAKTIGQLWTLSSNTSVSLGTGGAAAGGASGGVSEQLRYRVEPSEFVSLKKGGVENDCQVECIAFRSGRKFNASGENHIRVVFNQNLGAPSRA